MNSDSAFGFNWLKEQSGILVPNGTSREFSSKADRTYLHIKGEVIAVRELFAKHDVKIRKDSSLAKFLNVGEMLSDEWLLGGAKNVASGDVFRGAVCGRLVEAILTTADAPANVAKTYLEKISRGSVDLLSRIESEAKNFLWELELLNMLRIHRRTAELAEPDIVAKSKSGKVGFACKKIYSEKNVSKVLQKGVQQIERSGLPGILAINLDENVPNESIMRVKNFAQLRQMCNLSNEAFLNNHRVTIEKYCCSGRVLGIFISTAVVADLSEERVRLSNARESLYWSSTLIDSKKSALAREFFEEFTP